MPTLSSPTSLVSQMRRDRLEQVPCPGCRAILLVPVGTDGALCTACRRGAALADMAKLLNDVRDLRVGRGVFLGMTTAERSEQLEALGLPPIDKKPRFPGFKNLSDERLIQIVAGEAFCNPDERADSVAEATMELARRLEKWEPTPREQDEMESTALVLAGDPDTY